MLDMRCDRPVIRLRDDENDGGAVRQRAGGAPAAGQRRQGRTHPAQHPRVRGADTRRHEGWARGHVRQPIVYCR